MLDAIVGEKDGLLELAKVDIDDNPELALQCGVSVLLLSVILFN